jgi:catechol 2,3-dioxygenase-like lactoylglutathione lyase family enzyme
VLRHEIKPLRRSPSDEGINRYQSLMDDYAVPEHPSRRRSHGMGVTEVRVVAGVWRESRRTLMTSTHVGPVQQPTTGVPTAATVDLKLEVVVLPVTDVDRAKRFYEGLGWRLDADFSGGEKRVVQFTPPGSPCSVHLGKGLTTAAAGSFRNLYLVVSDMQAARSELNSRGANLGPTFHFDRFGEPPTPGPDPTGASYETFATFSDPDGNSWSLQEIKTRLPGRGLSSPDVATLTELLRETEMHHGEPTAPKHHWSGWYAAYIVAREQGRTPDEAAKDARHQIERSREPSQT